VTTIPMLDVLPVVTPADHVIGPPQGEWTYAAYVAIPDDGRRYEVIGGTLYMAPATSGTHQSTITWFIYYFVAHIQIPSLGHLFGVPLDVRLADEDTVQPDVLVVLNTNLGRITFE
jgi:hypothetical protein